MRKRENRIDEGGKMRSGDSGIVKNGNMLEKKNTGIKILFVNNEACCVKGISI
jgi:hypothetical protein